MRSLKTILAILLVASMVPPIVFLLFNLGGGSGGTSIGDFITNILYSIGPTVSLTTGSALLINFLQKKFPWGKTPIARLILEVAAIVLMAIGVAYLFSCANPLVPGEADVSGLFVTNLLFNLVITLFVVTIVEAAFFFNQWKQTRLEREQLEKEHYKAQFQNLKNQINPHLLFNSLNALTSLIENDQEMAVDYVQNLSRYLRMVLNHSNSEAIELKGELDLLQHYHTLQRARFGDAFQIKIEIPQDVMQLLIPPLALQMLVENAVKHNVISKSQPLLVEVAFREPNFIDVTNKKVLKQVHEDSTGVGLENIKSRYQLLGQYKIEVDDTEDYFKVSIPLLKLESNAHSDH